MRDITISVSNPIGRAMARSGLVLFKPFRWKKWAAIGVAAWAASVNEWTGFGALPNVLPQLSAMLVEKFDQVMEFIKLHQGPMLAGALGLALLLGGLYLLYRWVSCRGQLMILDAVVANGLMPRESWRRHRELGNSLMKLRISLDLIMFNIFLLVLIIAGFLLWQDLKVMFSGLDYRLTGWTIGAIIVAVFGFFASALLSLGLVMFLNCLVTPVIFARKMPAREAFRHTWREIFLREKKACILFLLMMVLTEWMHGMATALAMIVVAIVTLCIGYALLLVPVLSLAPWYPATTLALPVECFARAYCLYFIEQFGPDYRVISDEVAPAGFEVIVNQPPMSGH